MLNQEEVERVHQIVRDSVRESGMHLGILRKIREELGDKAVKTGISVMETWSRTPEGLEAKQRMEASFQDELAEKERARREAKERREQEWRAVHAYRWMMGPVPVWDEEEEEVIFVPLTDNIVEVEAIRACSREWEAGDRRRRLHAHLFDHLAQFDLDWENIVRRENRLAMEFIDGAPFNNRDEAYNL